MNKSPSEDDEDNAEFYDAQESDTFTLSLPGEESGASGLRERTDSQGSDDGSSSEGDPTPLLSGRIVTDATNSSQQQQQQQQDKQQQVAKFDSVSVLFVVVVELWYFSVQKNQSFFFFS